MVILENYCNKFFSTCTNMLSHCLYIYDGYSKVGLISVAAKTNIEYKTKPDSEPESVFKTVQMKCRDEQ